MIPNDLDPTEWDDDEPYPLEGMQLGPADVGELTGIALSAAECVFTGCDLSLVSFHGVKTSRFDSCKLRGTRFTKHLTNVTFEQSQLAECVFRMMAFKNVTVQSSQLTSCDFYGSELADVAFPDSSISGVGFDACTLSNVDLCQASELLIGDPRTLAGARIAEAHVHSIAHRLAELTGIHVENP